MDGLSHNNISMETLQTSIVNAIRSSKKRTPFNYKYGCKQHPENIKRNEKNRK